MDDLIQALAIFRKYGNPAYPTHCEHDELFICGIDPTDVSEEDKLILKGLGFFVSKDGGFRSFRFGSA
jgi:hypothetical protein